MRQIPVHGSFVVGDLGPGLVARVALEVAPGVALVQREDRREVVAGRPRQAQTVLLRPAGCARGGARGPGRTGSPARDTAGRGAPGGTRPGRRTLGQRPQRRFAVGAQDACNVHSSNVSSACSYASPPSGATGRSSSTTLNGDRASSSARRAHRSRRTAARQRRRATDGGAVVVNGVERADLGHRPRNPSGPRREPHEQRVLRVSTDRVGRQLRMAAARRRLDWKPQWGKSQKSPTNSGRVLQNDPRRQAQPRLLGDPQRPRGDARPVGRGAGAPWPPRHGPARPDRPARRAADELEPQTAPPKLRLLP